MPPLRKGNVLRLGRVAEARGEPIFGSEVHAIRWDSRRGYVIDGWPLELCDTSDPRKFLLQGHGWKIMALTSLAWLLPVEISADGLEVVAMHYDKEVAPQGKWQCYGLEDERISRVNGRYLMTTYSVSPERHST